MSNIVRVFLNYGDMSKLSNNWPCGFEIQRSKHTGKMSGNSQLWAPTKCCMCEGAHSASVRGSEIMKWGEEIYSSQDKKMMYAETIKQLNHRI